MTNIEKLLLTSYITEASYIDDYWTITKEGFTEKFSKLGIKSITNKNEEKNAINALVNVSLPIPKERPPKWIEINELDAVLVVDIMVEDKIKRFISLRGTETNGFYGKLAIPIYLATRWANFSESFDNFKETIHTTITEAVNDPEINEVIICGHSYGGAMVGEFFRTKENQQYEIPIIGATFGSPGTGDFLVENHYTKFFKLVNNFSKDLFNIQYKKSQPIKDLHEITNTTDVIPILGMVAGNTKYGQHYSVKSDRIGHSMNAYIEYFKKLYQKEQQKSDLMYGLFKQADKYYKTWKKDYEYYIKKPLSCVKKIDTEEMGGWLATRAMSDDLGVKSKKQQQIHFSFMKLGAWLLEKINPTHSEAYDKLLANEYKQNVEKQTINNSLLTTKLIDQEEMAAIRATASMLAENSIINKKPKRIHTRLLKLGKTLLDKINPTYLEAYTKVLDNERKEDIETEIMIGTLRGLQHKRANIIGANTKQTKKAQPS